MSITPPRVGSVHHGGHHQATRKLASLTATVFCNNDKIWATPIRDGRATGGEWMYWWPQYDNATYFWDEGIVAGGPLFANRAGTTSFYYSTDLGKTWIGPSSTVSASMSPFAWGNLMSVDDEVQFIPDNGPRTDWIDYGDRTAQSYTGPHARIMSNGIAACSY
jgi:hypothetical protein